MKQSKILCNTVSWSQITTFASQYMKTGAYILLYFFFSTNTFPWVKENVPKDQMDVVIML